MRTSITSLQTTIISIASLIIVRILISLLPLSLLVLDIRKFRRSGPPLGMQAA